MRRRDLGLKSHKRGINLAIPGLVVTTLQPLQLVDEVHYLERVKSLVLVTLTSLSKSKEDLISK